MAVPLILGEFSLNYLLPFALIFTLIFAILQKTKLLGDDKRQIDAIIGAIVGLILIATPFARKIVVELMPFMAVSAAILLVFMLLYGFISGKKEGDILHKWWKIALVGILAVSLVIALLVITGYWDLAYGYLFFSSEGNQIWVNGLIIIVIVGAIIAVIKGESKSSS